MGKTLHALLWSVLFGFATTATATVISFSYTGVPNCAPHSCRDELTGSFAFADGLLFVDRANLSAFSLTDTFTYTDVPIAFTVTRSLADLQSFAATLDAAQNLLSLTFKTDNFNDQVGGVVFTSTAIPNVEVVHCFTAETKDGPQEHCGAFSTGSFITTTAVSEPSIIPLLVIGLGMAGFGYLGIGYEYLKRRRVRTNLT